MPSSVSTGAIYGTGVYGTSVYGSFGVIVSVDGVVSSFVLNDTLQISADAVHIIDTPNTDPLDAFIGDVFVSADANIVPTGIVGTTALGILTIDATTILLLDAVEATGTIGTLVVAADANVSPTQVDLVSIVGVVLVSGDSNLISVSVEATGTVQEPTVAASAVAIVTGASTSSAVGVITLETNNYIDVSGIEVAGIIGTPVVVAKATVTVTGVFGSTATGTVGILENEVVIPTSLLVVITAGVLTISTTAFNFNAVAAQYSRNRTAYVPRKPTAQERTVIIPAGQ